MDAAGDPDTSEKAGFQLLVATTGNDPAAEKSAIDAMLDRIIDVPVDASATPPDGIPVVRLNRRSDSSITASVVSDDVTGLDQLTAAVIRAGHADLAVVVGPRSQHQPRPSRWVPTRRRHPARADGQRRPHA